MTPGRLSICRGTLNRDVELPQDALANLENSQTVQDDLRNYRGLINIFVIKFETSCHNLTDIAKRIETIRKK